MDFSNLKTLTIPEGEVTKITDASGNVLWQSGYTNQVPLSTESDGKTIYNGGLGYKNGYRIRSGGAEGADGNASHTGFIKAKGSDVVRLSGYNALKSENANAINVYDANHTNLGQITAGYATAGYGIFASTYKEYGWGNAKGVKEEKTGVYVWTVPTGADIAYIRVTGYTLGDGSKMIVTINEEIE